MHDDPKAKCQVWPLQSLEDVRHVLEWCDNDAAKEIRTRWYERLREKAVKAAPALWEAIRSGLRCKRVASGWQAGCKPVASGLQAGLEALLSYLRHERPPIARSVIDVPDG